MTDSYCVAVVGMAYFEWPASVVFEISTFAADITSALQHIAYLLVLPSGR